MEFFIDLAGRSRKVGQLSVAIAVSKIGYIHVRLIERTLAGRATTDRTVIVNVQPYLVSELALAAFGYKLADLNPERTVVVVEGPNPGCWVVSDQTSALRLMANLARTDADTPARVATSPAVG